MRIVFWGTRGSIPVSSRESFRYGGNTTCVEVISSEGIRCILDAGSGLRDLGNRMALDMPLSAHLFFTHYHWDHIQGFPFFVPAFIPSNRFFLYGQDKDGIGLKGILEKNLLFPPHHPVGLEIMKAEFSYQSLGDHGKIVLSKDFSVSYQALNHPNGVLGFRFEDHGRSFVFMTDVEHSSSEGVDAEVIALSLAADVLAYDCQYFPHEYPLRVGWGHSTYEKGLEIAKKACVKKMLMIHHDPSHNDAILDEKLSQARRCFQNSGIKVDIAMDGLEILL